jgi:hypothetical protein
MSGTAYVIIAYGLGLGLLWGYGISMAISAQLLGRRESRERGES